MLKEWVANHAHEALVTIGHNALESIDTISMVAVIVLLLLGMFGSKRAWRGIYWTIAGYIVFSVVRLSLQ